ncbi:MAG: hypothetical protein ACM359_11395 [Bacillota bacterium]
MGKDPIILALEQQVECYRRLAKLAAVQHEHVQREQTEELLQVLGHRQEVLEQITRLERTLAPVKKQWGTYAGRLDRAERARAEAMLGETRELLEQITTADRNDALVLQQRKINLGRQINQAAAAKQVNRNYAMAAYGTRRSSVDVQR